jgi:hypothetical protein
MQAQGKQQALSLMQPQVYVQGHPFVPTLLEWQSGVPVDCGPDWSDAALDAAIFKGNHISAMTPDAIKLVRDDVGYQVDAGFCSIVPWDILRSNRPPSLKISPLAVVPQIGRRGRMILDLSFDVRQPKPKGSRKMGPVLQHSVNKTTNVVVPEIPVRALGTVLPKLFRFMAATPPQQVIHFSKIDLSDGFWRLITSHDAAYNFCYVLPAAPGDGPPHIVVPSALQMGWKQSPAAFCAATETGRDIIQGYIDKRTTLPSHPMEAFMTPARPAKKQSLDSDMPSQATYVYVDDFILAAVEDSSGTRLANIARAALHGIHSIFPSPTVTGHANGKDPISQKKLDKGDARWDPSKVILGFLVNGKHRTVCLPADKAQRIGTEIAKALKKSKVSLAKFQSLNGKLRHAATIFPAAQALFTPLNRALATTVNFVSLGKRSALRHALLDFKFLLCELARRPTHVSEVVRCEPEVVQFVDAAKRGAGGVIFGQTRPLPPTVWSVQFPLDIQQRIVSQSNPKGDLTNSDLELAAVVIGQMAVAQITSMTHTRCLTFSDNTPTVSWATKMASRAETSVAYNLLRGFAMLQRASSSAPPYIASIAGDSNGLADTASRIEKVLHPAAPPLSFTAVPISELLTLFDSKFPLSQEKCWHGVTIPAAQLSLVISTLRGQRLTLQRWMVTPECDHGPTGPDSALKLMSTLGCENFPDCKARLTSWLSENASDEDIFVPTDVKSNTAASKRLYGTFAKPTCWLANQTLGELLAPPI